MITMNIPTVLIDARKCRFLHCDVMRLSLAVLLVGAFVVLSFQPSSAQDEKHEQQSPTASQGSPSPAILEPNQQTQTRPSVEEKQNSRLGKLIRWLDRNDKATVALSTISTAAFTGALVLATLALWLAGRRHSERELRAYISITELGTEGFWPLSCPKTEAVIKNCGKTPAFDFKILVAFDLHKIPRDEFSLPKQIDQCRGTIGPGVEITAGGISKKALTKEAYEGVIRGEGAAFFFGSIEYTDAFKKKRFTNFRYIGKATGKGIDWEATESGNDSS
jgi:hypothetical protein